MKKAISILTVIVALCLAAWVLAWGIALVSGAVLFSRALDSLADLVSMPGCVKSMVFWTFLIPFSILASRMFAPFRKVRIRAILFVASVLGMYWTITSVVNHHRFFDPTTGKSLKWVDLEPDGHASFFSRPGVNPENGHPLVPVTPVLLQALAGSQGTSVRPKPADPEKADWFSPVSRAPVLYYVVDETNGTWEFFTGAPGMFHPRTGKRIEPVTQTVRVAWEADMKAQREVADRARLEAEEAALQAKQQAEDQQRLAEAQQHQQELQAEAQQREAAEKARQEAEEKETARQVEQRSEEQQRLAEEQRHKEERLAEEQQQVATEKARLEAEAAEIARRTKEQAEEQQRLAEEQRREQEQLATTQQQAPANNVVPSQETVSESATVYSVPTTYVAPPVTYYYRTPVWYPYVVVRAPPVVRWSYPPAVRAAVVPMYRYAPVYSPGCRQGRFGR